MAGLQGSLKGNMKITGNTDSPLINGYLQLMSTSVNVPMIGTSFGFSSDQLKIVDNQILFQKYSINGPNKQPLVSRIFSHSDQFINNCDRIPIS